MTSTLSETGSDAWVVLKMRRVREFPLEKTQIREREMLIHTTDSAY